MQRIRIYGAENTGIESVPRPVEPSAKMKIRYRRFKVLTITALVLLFVLLVESMMFVAIRLLFQQDLYVKAIALGMEIVILAMGIALFFGYKHLYHFLSYMDMGAIIITEIILVLGQFIVCNYSIPVLYAYLIVFSIIFILYATICSNCSIGFKVVIAIIPVLVLFILNFIYLNSFDFTPRYVYISSAGYHDKINDSSNYYYENAVNENFGDYYAIDDIIELTGAMSNTRTGVHRVNDVDDEVYDIGSLEYLNSIYSNIMPMGDVINFDNRYDDSFFEDYSLYFSVLELENPNDTIECTDIQYSFKYARPIIEYTRNDTVAEDTTERAVCVMVYEVPVEVEEAIFGDIAGFTTDKAVIDYKQ